MPLSLKERYGNCPVGENYDISQFSDFTALEPRDRHQIAYLLGQMGPWVKAEAGVRRFLDEALTFCQESTWIEKNRKDRSQAIAVFLPEQYNLSYHPGFDQLTKVAPNRQVFDEDEWVVQGITKNSLGWDNGHNPKLAYIIGRIQNPNDLINLAQVAQRLKELGAREITFLGPYLGWTRQDKKDDTRGEPETVAAIMQYIKAMGINRMGVLDAHSLESARLALQHDMPFCSFSSWKYLVDYLLKSGFIKDSALVVGPDIGRESHSARAADYMGIPILSLAKDRVGGNKKVVFQPLALAQIDKLRGREVIIFDDIIASAKTLGEISELIGPDVASIVVLASHASLIKDAIPILSQKIFSRVIFTDSRTLVNPPPFGGKFEVLSCIPLLARFLQEDLNKHFNPWSDPYFKDIVSRH